MYWRYQSSGNRSQLLCAGVILKNNEKDASRGRRVEFFLAPFPFFVSQIYKNLLEGINIYLHIENVRYFFGRNFTKYTIRGKNVHCCVLMEDAYFAVMTYVDAAFLQRRFLCTL